MLRQFYQALGKLEWGLASIGAGLCLFAIMMITVISVFGRYVLLTDLIPGSFNIIERMLFPMMVFWALPLAHRDGVFPRLEILPNILPKRLGNAVAILALTVELAIFVYLTWRLSLFSLAGFESGRTMQLGSGYFPVWPFMMMVPVAFGLMLIEMVWQIGGHIRYFASRRPAEITRQEMF
ncbi:TRAP-type mannitol/chloroaromatic compound transport system, small permease component [Lutimaribacter pacificus]|uniref:TRAP transporter small permease protein n=1 Tax=Lutimaribacter pacificus TaxID=391948 RepID=A0A1H0ENF4_9RHOB|nr:TRAP transporter small permease [Lutimaribacter pacificus]SDN83849.1 TRAP-type mannitol/chloroaromatic compound transport system, small permease component [Lutimaribacter pacificus]SHK50950.1 TRAP-type mannitol/chloroaromatic compound transport system, small permease component [Lutimaribacter pacificus]